MTPEEMLDAVARIESELKSLRIFAQEMIQERKQDTKPKPTSGQKRINSKQYIHRMAVHALLNRGFINVDFGIVGRWLNSFGYGVILECAKSYGASHVNYDLSDSDKLRYFVGGLKREHAESDHSNMVVFALKSLHDITDYKEQSPSASTRIVYIPEEGENADKLRAFWSGDE